MLKYLLLFVWCVALALGGQAATPIQRDTAQAAALKLLFDYPSRFGVGVTHFNAIEYTKFQLDADRKNRAVELLPSLFKLKRGQQNYIAESVNELRFDAPHNWTKKEVSIVGTLPRLHEIQLLVDDYMYITLYERTLLKNRFLSPLNIKNYTHYRYRIEGERQQDGRTYYRLRFKPKIHNPQLVRGHVWMDAQTGAVQQIYFVGKYDVVNIGFTATMGKEGLHTLLPVEEHINARLKFLGNKISCNYYLNYAYSEVNGGGEVVPKRKRRASYDLTQQYTLLMDTTAYVNDLSLFEGLRPIPLTQDERLIYQQNELVKIESDSARRSKKSQQFFGALGDVLLDKHDVDLQRVGKIRFAPIITPTMMQYSQRRGLAIRSDMRYTKIFADGDVMRARLRAGYNFKQHQFYWSLPFSIEYRPARQGLFTFEIGNGNHISSSKLVDELKGSSSNLTPDSLANLIDGLQLGTYRDFYLTANNRVDLVAGLSLEVGLIYHHRELVNTANAKIAEEVIEGTIKEEYRSLAPRFRMVWTPRVYYYWKGARRKELYSNFPTLFVDYERGIKAGRARMQYSRWEFGSEYRLKFWELSSLWIRAGGGFYDSSKETYFVDFANFRYRSLPEGWSDDLSGQFQLLRSSFYNSSNYYGRICATYESPMMLFTRLKYLTNYIQTERLYFNTLVADRLTPYTELGYGLGTMLFNCGMFVGLSNGKFDGVGFKINIELFE